jgi:hypothetical protein
MTFAHLVLIRFQTWPPQTILVSDCLISKKIVDAAYQDSIRFVNQSGQN